MVRYVPDPVEAKGWAYDIWFHIGFDETQLWPRPLVIYGTYRGAQALRYAQERQRERGGFIVKAQGWEQPLPDDPEPWQEGL